MEITKQEVDKLLVHFSKDTWIDEEEEAEFKEELYSLIEEGKLDALTLEMFFDTEYMICSPAYLWELMEEIWNEE